MFTSGSWLLITLKSERISDKSTDDYSSVRLQGLGRPLVSPNCPQVTKRAASHSNGVEELHSLLSHLPISKSERLSGHFCLPVSHKSSPSAGSCLRLFTMILSPLNTTYGIQQTQLEKNLGLSFTVIYTSVTTVYYVYLNNPPVSITYNILHLPL